MPAAAQPVAALLFSTASPLLRDTSPQRRSRWPKPASKLSFQTVLNCDGSSVLPTVAAVAAKLVARVVLAERSVPWCLLLDARAGMWAPMGRLDAWAGRETNDGTEFGKTEIPPMHDCCSARF